MKLEGGYENLQVVKFSTAKYIYKTKKGNSAGCKKNQKSKENCTRNSAQRSKISQPGIVLRNFANSAGCEILQIVQAVKFRRLRNFLGHHLHLLLQKFGQKPEKLTQ